MYYQHVSDIENLSVEWENDLGHRWWQCFTTAEEMNKVLRGNEAYNNQPDVKAAIQADLKAENEWLVRAGLSEALEFAAHHNETITVEGALGWGNWSDESKAIAAPIVEEHNKRVLATKQVSPATFKLGELLKNINLTIG